MRNFGEKSFFRQPIPILDPFERVKGTHYDSVSTSKIQLLVHSDKEKYQKRELIELDLLVTDQYGNLLPADLSIAVTDLNVVKPLSNPGQMNSYFQMKFDSVEPLKAFEIEKGITLKGTIKHKKRGVAAPITAVLGNLQDIVTFSSRLDGSFSMTGFQFYDSTKIYLQALSKRRKPFGEFSLTSISPPEVTLTPPPLLLSIKRETSAIRPVEDYNDQVIMLKEVIVDAKREARDPFNKGTGDYTIGSETIEKTNPLDVLSLLQARIPGLRVFRFLDRSTGQMRETVKIGPPTSFLTGSNGQQGALSEPLLIIDGVPISSTELVSDALRRINVRDVERIEVSKYAGAALYGSRGGDGVIAVFTRVQAGHGAEKISTAGFTSFPFFGYTSRRNFSMPDYSQKSEHSYVDNRTTIYWNPDVWLDGVGKEKVSFYSADKQTYYLVTIMGVTATNEPVEYRKVIQISE